MAEPAAAVPKRVSGDGNDFAQEAWNALLTEKDLLGLPNLRIQPLADFLKNAEAQPLQPDEKETILQEAAFLIGQLYPHLPFKQQLYSSRPLQMLEATQTAKGELDWHANVIFSLSSVLDAHTLYGLPSPYLDAVAFLPFALQVYWDRGQCAHFVVTSLMKTLSDPPDSPLSFGPGAEIVSWNGAAADDYIPTSRGRIPSGNSYARIQRGTMLAPLLPLRFCQPPAESMAVLQYIPAAGGEAKEIRFPWGVATGLGSKTGFPGNAYSVNPVTHCAAAMGRAIVRGYGKAADPRQTPAAQPTPLEISQLPEVFEFQHSGGTARPGLPDPQRLRPASNPNARFGYLRIKKFSLGNTLGDALVDEFRRILEQVMVPMAPDGLILDIRGNPGGDIQVAESLLQMISPQAIEPANFHLANTATVRDFLKGLQNPDFSKLDAAAILKVIEVRKDLHDWIADGDKFDPSSPLSPGHPLTDPAQANAIGRLYHGKCALLVDALSYSAADIFAAGFQDHEIGPVIGTDATTGGGGANVWSHSDLANHLVAIPNIPDPKPLPREAGLSLAIRRATRVKKHAGQPIEDFGVKADVFFAAGCAEELLAGSQSVIQFACDYLLKPKDPQVRIKSFQRLEDHWEIEVEDSNLDFVQAYVDHNLCIFAAAEDGVIPKLRVSVPKDSDGLSEVHVMGGYFYRAAGTENFVYTTEPAKITS